ncbi:MAG: hypothetical protein HY985_04195 [Magnetospirillum sp.]|nr:hypothetical protein [Magnetospirillum sp.]
MIPDPMAFPVAGMEGLNKLAVFLNAATLGGDWHFARGSRFDQEAVTIDFDDPTDLAPTWKRYCDARLR